MPEEQTSTSAAAFGAAHYGAAAAANEAAATEAARLGMNSFREAAARLFQCGVEQRQGNLFEYVEVAKFNAAARSAGATVTARVTAANGHPHSPADIELMEGSRVIDSVQAKSGKSAPELTHRVSQEKYHGMQKLVPSDKEAQVRELAQKRLDQGGGLKAEEYADTLENLSGELRAGEIRSGGTSYDEAVWAARHPKVYAALTEIRYVTREVAVTAGHSAAAAALVGGAVSTARNLLAVSRGEISHEQAVSNIGKDSGAAAVRGGTIGAGSALIRYGAAKAGVEVLGKSNAATALAGAVLDVGVTLYSYAKGEITIEQATEQVGQTGACSLGSLYLGAVAASAAAAVGAPVAAAALAATVGSVAGYVIVAATYQSCIAIIRSGRLADEESARLLTLCEVACAQMAHERAEFERALEVHLQAREAEFAVIFRDLDAAMGEGDAGAANAALVGLTELLGRKLQFETLEEFNGFMQSGETLVI